MKVELYERQKGICNGCRNNYLIKDMVLDHIIPVKVGGNSDITNRQMLCHNCNQVKGVNGMDYLERRLPELYGENMDTLNHAYKQPNRRPSITLPIPKQLLEDINSVTDDLGCTRAGFIIDCIREGAKSVYHRRKYENNTSQADKWKGEFPIGS